MMRLTTFVKPNASIPFYGSFASLPRITPPAVSTGCDDAGRHPVNPLAKHVQPVSQASMDEDSMSSIQRVCLVPGVGRLLL